jgi:para-nitrobenzyl esterase
MNIVVVESRARTAASPLLVASVLLGSLLALADAAAAAERTPVVATSNGPIRGALEGGGIHVFKGVRYGAPPVGPLRFKPPLRP